ncbi:hypothetical protein BDN71DRAFT_1485144 [Pleurotus eryngii]|uniref:Uncharacterized protein n=1 Tax=Pleurotus eryngii TaxID=5323 RepID=A0A9P5ZKQ3_PLEER|nr:hypothetical protein BDN71DRAFT_1485144 [Pleurotus eryngii]
MDNRGLSGSRTDRSGDTGGQQENDIHNNETGGRTLDTANDVGNGGAQQPEGEGENEEAGFPEATMGEGMNGTGQQEEPDEEEGNTGAGDPPEDQDLEELLLQETSSIADMALKFINLLCTTTLQESGMDPDDYLLQIDDPDLLLSIKIYKACSLASEATYNTTRQAITECFPDCRMPTLDQVKQHIRDLSGIKPIVHHMCENPFLAFTGPFELLDQCPKCPSPRYMKPGSLEPCKAFSTILIGLQIQALYLQLHATGGQISKYYNYISGHEYLDAIQAGLIKDIDIVLMYSLDGCQLYQSKTSDCWIFVWIFLNLDGNCRYKKVYITSGIVIAGLDKPKNLDFFLFPTFYHVSALQHEGLKIWDADLNTVFNSDLFLLFGTADGPGLVLHNRLVGHKECCGCHLHCPVTGCHKPGEPAQYLVLMLPDNYTVHGCNHADVDIQALSGSYSSSTSAVRHCTNTEFKKLRLETGICKPYVIAMNTLDFMHIPAFNIPKLLFLLFWGKIDCEKTDSKNTWDWAVLQGKVWKSHGAEVADCTPYLPGSFNHPPCNPAEKISSGYKVWEFLIDIYSLGLALFYSLCCTHVCLLEFMIQFEELYYQRHADQIHFVCQSIHILTHAANVSQWTMDIYCAQMNTLQAMVLVLQSDTTKIPQNTINFGNGYVLFHVTDICSCKLPLVENRALSTYMHLKGIQGTVNHVVHWAHLALPNGQTAWSRWKELQSKEAQRVSCQVKVLMICFMSQAQFGKVLYYFYLTSNGPSGEEDIRMIDIKDIDSVVAVLPHPQSSICIHPKLEGHMYIAKKPGLDIARMAGFEDLDDSAGPQV